MQWPQIPAHISSLWRCWVWTSWNKCIVWPIPTVMMIRSLIQSITKFWTLVRIILQISTSLSLSTAYTVPICSDSLYNLIRFSCKNYIFWSKSVVKIDYYPVKIRGIASRLRLRFLFQDKILPTPSFQHFWKEYVYFCGVKFIISGFKEEQMQLISDSCTKKSFCKNWKK